MAVLIANDRPARKAQEGHPGHHQLRAGARAGRPRDRRRRNHPGRDRPAAELRRQAMAAASGWCRGVNRAAGHRSARPPQYRRPRPPHAASGSAPASQEASSPALKASPAPVESVSCDSGAGTLIRSVGRVPGRAVPAVGHHDGADRGQRRPEPAQRRQARSRWAATGRRRRPRTGSSPAPAVAMCTAACGSTDVVQPLRRASRARRARPAGIRRRAARIRTGAGARGRAPAAAATSSDARTPRSPRGRPAWCGRRRGRPAPPRSRSAGSGRPRTGSRRRRRSAPASAVRPASSSPTLAISETSSRRAWRARPRCSRRRRRA